MWTSPHSASGSSSGGFSPTRHFGPGMDDSDAQRLARAFEAAQTDDGDRSLPELRAATLAFVAALKSDNLAPERVVVTLKTVLASIGASPLSLYTGNQASDATRRHQMYRRVFTWSLDAYFGADSPSDARS